MIHQYYQNNLIENENEYKSEINKYTMAISKVKSVQANGTFDSTHGIPLENGKIGFYKFEYEMEDYEIVNANHKQSTPIPVGTEVEYEIINPQYNTGKVKKYNPDFQKPQNKTSQTNTQFKADPAKQNSIEAQTALKEANVYHATHGFVTHEDMSLEVLVTADLFYKWLKSKS